MILFYSKDGQRVGSDFAELWSYSQKKNREGTGSISVNHCPDEAAYASLYAQGEKLTDVFIKERAQQEKNIALTVGTLEGLFKHYKTPHNWQGWNKKPLNFVLADMIYGFDYIKKTNIADFSQYIEKVNIGLNKIKDGDIHLDFYEHGDSLHYHEKGYITFSFDCGERASQRFVRWSETQGDKTFIAVQSCGSDAPITNISDVDFTHAPVRELQRGVKDASSTVGIPIESNKRYVAVRFIFNYTNVDWISDFATHKVYTHNNVLVDRTVRGFTPVMRAFEIITRKKTPFLIKSVPTIMTNIVEGVDLSNITLWEAVQRIRKKSQFDTRCYLEDGAVFFEFAPSLVKNKVKKTEYMLRAGDEKTPQLNNTTIQERSESTQKVNVLHCYGAGDTIQQVYVRIPESGTYDGNSPIEADFTNSAIKTKENLKKAGVKKIKELRKEENPTFEVKTSLPVRLFDLVSLVHPKSNKIYTLEIQEEHLSYKQSALTKKLGVGGAIFNPLAALIKEPESVDSSKSITPPISIVATGKVAAILLEWVGESSAFIIKWKARGQGNYNYTYTAQQRETFEHLNIEHEYMFSVASVYKGQLSTYSPEVVCKPVTDEPVNPHGSRALFKTPFNSAVQSLPAIDPPYSLWQEKIIEYDCTGKDHINMSFDDALHNVIILSGTLSEDFVFKPYFDRATGNGAKHYQIVYALKGTKAVTISTGESGTQRIYTALTPDTFGTGVTAVVDRRGNVWRIKTGNTTGAGFPPLDIAGTLLSGDYFVVEQNDRIMKADSLTALRKIQAFDSPIGEVKTFYEGNYKHGFLCANGLPFSPDVFPAFDAYVKKFFSTETDTVTGWTKRPTITTNDGRFYFIKAVQGV